MAVEADADEKMASERIGRVLGEWKLERLIGVGGMAAVYAARGKDDKIAALKVLHPEMCRRADIRQRFAQEGTAATRVGHPGVVAVLGNGEEPDGTAFLVLELLEGDTLTDTMKREGTLPLPRLLDILDEVLDVLAAAHERGIVHRDLKPDNLFITPDGKVKVLDFGIARVLDDIPGAYKTRTGITLGTVPFMSPEQALGKRAQVDGRSDIFSLGAMMFRILAGRHVHTAETDAELLVAMASQPAPPLSSVVPAVSPGLSSVVDLALAFSKDSRYPDARTMQSDLRAVKAGSAPPHASNVRSSREMATRTDVPVPAISMVAGPKGATVPDSPSFTVADTQAPASFRGVDLPRPERADPEQGTATAAPTAENPAFAATTARMVAPPDGRTITSTPPKKRRWVLPAIIGTVALTALAGGGYVALSQSGTTDSNPSDPSAAAAPTAALPPGIAPPSDPAAAAAAAQTEQGAANPQAPGALQPAKQLMPAKPGAPGAPTNAPPGAATTAAPSPTAATNPSPTPTTPAPPNPATAPPPPSPNTATAPPSPPPNSPSPPPNSPSPSPPAPPPPSPNTAPAPPSPPPAPPSPPAPTHTTAPPAPTPTTPTPPTSPSSKWNRGRSKNH